MFTYIFMFHVHEFEHRRVTVGCTHAVDWQPYQSRIRPTNGEIRVAPFCAAATACESSKHECMDE
eukprot:1016097-Pyramimonas_sp.AAC.1